MPNPDSSESGFLMPLQLNIHIDNHVFRVSLRGDGDLPHAGLVQAALADIRMVQDGFDVREGINVAGNEGSSFQICRSRRQDYRDSDRIDYWKEKSGLHSETQYTDWRWLRVIKKTDNYMEAKRIIINSADDDYSKAFEKSMKRLIVILILFCIGLGVGIAFYTHMPLAALGVIPFSLLGIIITYMPVVQHRKNKEYIKGGKLFREKSHHEIIEMANNYAEAYNRFESKRNRRRAKRTSES